jgi:hypothetical protein
MKIPHGLLNLVWIGRKHGAFKTFINFNPPIPPTTYHTMWFCGGKPIRELKLDPIEWEWWKQGYLKTFKFLTYASNKGYGIGM